MGFSTIGDFAETPSGGAGSAEHAGVEDNSSSNADQIQINDASVVINKDGDDCDFVVEGDTEPHLLVCDASTERVGFGTPTPDTQVEVVKASANAEVAISCYHDTEATTPKLSFRKADNTEASPALVDDNAVLGTVSFQGHDGSGFHEGAKIEARVMGTPSDGTDMPTELSFWTTSNAAGTASQRVTISENGSLGIGSTAPTAAVQIYKDLNAADDLGDFDNYHLVLQGGNATSDTVGILLCSASDTYGGSSIVHFDTGGGGKGDLAFYTKQATGAAAPTEVLRLKDDGRGVSEFTASAWLNMNGEGTIAIRDSHNISSLADNATGKHTATFSVAMGDANYCVAGANFDTDETLQSSNFVAESRTTTTVAIWNSNAQNGTYYDAEFLNFVIFGG